MDKKQFFESFVSPPSGDSGYRLHSFESIEDIFASIKSALNEKLRKEFESIEKEVLFRAWAFDEICNGGIFPKEQENSPTWALIVISVSEKILFASQAYCHLSGLSLPEIQSHAELWTLYSRVYEEQDVQKVEESIIRLRAGKGYRHMELSMKHSGKRISWSSFGWVGEALEIRSGRELHAENDTEKEQEQMYRGSVMNTARLIENLYQVAIHGTLSEENEQKLAWIQEFLSMFDFLWNHGEFFMEIIDIPDSKKGKILGYYNTLYAQFFRASFREVRSFKDIIELAHKRNVSDFLEERASIAPLSFQEEVFHTCKRCPVGHIYWQYSQYPHKRTPGYQRIWNMGLLTKKIKKRNRILDFFSFFSKK